MQCSYHIFTAIHKSLSLDRKELAHILDADSTHSVGRRPGIDKPDKAIGDLTRAARLDASLESLARPLLKDCTPILYRQWAKSYRTAARLDGYDAAKTTICLENDSATLRQAQSAIRGNIELIAVAMSFAQIDGVDFAPVIAKQAYDAEASHCRYLVLFFDYSGIPRWLLVDELREIDLADLVASGQSMGPPVADIRIRHPREQPFLRGEHARIEKEVKNDLRFDFDESELSIEFNRYSFGLQVLLEYHDE